MKLKELKFLISQIVRKEILTLLSEKKVVLSTPEELDSLHQLATKPNPEPIPDYNNFNSAKLKPNKYDPFVDNFHINNFEEGLPYRKDYMIDNNNENCKSREEKPKTKEETELEEKQKEETEKEQNKLKEEILSISKELKSLNEKLTPKKEDEKTDIELEGDELFSL